MDRPRKRSFDLSSDQLALLEARIKAKGLTSQYSQAKIYRCAASDRGPISFAQQRLWFLDKLEQGSPLYNIPNRFRITGTLDVPALQNSLAEIIRRHEVLRTTFHEENGQAFVRVNESQTLDLPLVDLLAVTEASGG